MPLCLTWGKTAHACQGLAMGPTQEGKPENMIKRIVIHPGKRRFEGTNVGLFCTILGHGTTLETQSDPGSSTMCFAGNGMSNHRMTNLWSYHTVPPSLPLTTVWCTPGCRDGELLLSSIPQMLTILFIVVKVAQRFKEQKTMVSLSLFDSILGCIDTRKEKA